MTKKKAAGIAIAHGLVSTSSSHLPIGALRPRQQSSTAIAEPSCLGVDRHNAHHQAFSCILLNVNSLL